MVEDIQGAINPIIQAMIASANLQKQGQQQDIEKERNKQEADARKEQLKQSQQILENMHTHMTAEDEANAMHAQANMLSTKASVAHTLQSMHGQGGVPDPMAVLGAMTPILSHALGGGGQIPQQQPIAPSQPQQAQPAPDQNSDQTPQQLPIAQNAPAPVAAPQADPNSIWGPGLSERNKMEAEAVGLKAKAEAEGKFPTEQVLANTQFTHQKTLQDARIESEEKVAAAGRTSQEKIAQLSRSSQYGIAQLEAKTSLQAVGMDPTTNQGMVSSLVRGGLTGDIKLNPANPIERLAYDNIQQIGGRTVDPKEIDALKQSQQLLPLFDKLESFANTLPDSRSGAFVTGHILGAKATLGISSKMQNDLNVINSQAMNVGRAVEGIQGRPLAVQLKLDLDSLASGAIPKEDALSRIQNLRDLYVNKQNNTIFGGMSPIQQEIIKQKYGIQPLASQNQGQAQPDWLRIAPQKNPNGKSLDPTTSLTEGHPVYK